MRRALVPHLGADRVGIDEDIAPFAVTNTPEGRGSAEVAFTAVVQPKGGS